MALKLARHTRILETGRIGLQGRCEDLIDNDEVKQHSMGGT